MPILWIGALALFVIAILTAIGGFFAPNKVTLWGIAAIVALLGLVFTIISAYDRVDTRNVGIITEFGRPVGVHGAGIVWHAPWKKVSELSEAIQLQAFEGQDYHNPGTAIQVRLANNSQAYVNENINWRLREGAAPKLFQDYGGNDVFDTIKTNLVDRQAQVALSKVFSTFNPQQTPPGYDPNNPAAAGSAVMVAADLPAMAAQVKQDLQDAVGQDVEILDVRIPRIFYDDGTQGRLDDFNKKVQETKNAQQDVATAHQRQMANDAIAASVQNPMTVVAQCINDQLKAQKDPGGCWGPMGGVGGAGSNLMVTVPKPGS